ncbi:MAG TPA: MFS transporter, partial [Pirellulales bacterium]|nr:MFS transporter [Pirellulales bacterium]
GTSMERRTLRRQALGLIETLRIGFLFGAIYFIQGISDPNSGLIAQPDNSLLRAWGKNSAEIATFGAILALPWCLKPLFGLLSDFVPLGRYRRKSYLIATSLAALIGFAGLYLTPLPEGADRPLLSWLMLASISIIFCDVVIDALMIETGQPLGITGRLQSVQWAAIQTGTILTGVIGGVLSEKRLQKSGFLLCGGLMLATFVLSLFFITEEPRQGPRGNFRQSMAKLKNSVQPSLVVVIGLFVFIWSLNPFCQAVLYLYATRALELSDAFYGKLVSLVAVGSLLACVGYNIYCRRVPMRWLLHVCILAGVVSTWVYWGLTGKPSAIVISLIAGLTYMTGSMVLVDLAARSCPLDAPGTLFALYMALCNLGAAAGTWLGGIVYKHGSDLWGDRTAFNVLILVSGLSTACCWLLVRFLPDRVLGVMGEDGAEQPSGEQAADAAEPAAA